MSRFEVVLPGQEIVVPGGVRFRREVEARRSRHRLYPVSVLYTLYALLALIVGLRSARPFLAIASFLLGVGVWTLDHHSPRGMGIAFGLTSGFWDVVHDTRIPPDIRRALYGPLPAERSRAGASLDLTPTGR